MVLYRPPFSDPEPKGSVLLAVGSQGWLKTALQIGGSILPPDAATFTRKDVVTVYSPLGALLPGWGIAILDTSDPLDTYDSASPEYKGFLSRRNITDGITTVSTPTLTSATANFTSNDLGKSLAGTTIPSGTTIAAVVNSTTVTMSQQATGSAGLLMVTIGTENVGLFHDGGGHLALKVLPPVGSVISQGTTLPYTVAWRLLINDEFVTGTETFNVGPAGTLVFGTFVTVQSIRDDYITPFSDAEISAIISKATEHVSAIILQVTDVPQTAPVGLVAAVRFEAERLVVLREITNSRAASNISQGGMSLSLPDALSRAEMLGKDRDKMIMAYLATLGIYGLKIPSLQVMRKRDDTFGLVGFGYPAG